MAGCVPLKTGNQTLRNFSTTSPTTTLLRNSYMQANLLAHKHAEKGQLQPGNAPTHAPRFRKRNHTEAHLLDGRRISVHQRNVAVGFLGRPPLRVRNCTAEDERQKPVKVSELRAELGSRDRKFGRAVRPTVILRKHPRVTTRAQRAWPRDALSGPHARRHLD